jgi:phosphoribosylanthranilate isomerase
MKTELKICGLRRKEDIEMVNEINPTYIGFVFAKSRRQVTIETAIELRKNLNSNIKVVGVFVDESEDNVVRAVTCGAVDCIQLHGSESNSYIQNIKKRVDVQIIKAIKMNLNEDSLNEYPDADFYLLDSGSGSGKTFDWRRTVNSTKPLFVAGGINIDNIEEAYRIFHPYSFDLSSSVEVDGFKNLDKMREIKEKLDSLNGDNHE